MNKTLSILLFLVITTPFLGTYLYLNSYKAKTRKEVKEIILSGIGRENLMMFKFSSVESASLLIWEHPREFEYCGQMYDIVEAKTCGDTTFYWCFADHRETRINKAIEQAVAKATGQDPVRKNQTERLTDFFKTLFQEVQFNWQAGNPPSAIVHYASCILNYSSLTSSPPSPPPKVVQLFI